MSETRRWTTEEVVKGIDHPGSAIAAVIQALRGNAPRPDDATLANALAAARQGHERVCETAQREYDEVRREIERVEWREGKLREHVRATEQRLTQQRQARERAESERDELRNEVGHLASQISESTFVNRPRLDRAEAALRELVEWANRMPDAGLTSDDPRYAWWNEGYAAREKARAIVEGK